MNAGVGGNSTVMARARFERDVLGENPDLVIIQFGINDAAVDVWQEPPASKPRVSLEEFEGNLRVFVDTLRECGVKVILMTPNPMGWTPQQKKLYGKPPYDTRSHAGFNVLLREYAACVGRVAREKEVALADVYAAYKAYDRNGGESVNDLLLDGMHPNGRGHRLAADLLMPLICGTSV